MSYDEKLRFTCANALVRDWDSRSYVGQTATEDTESVLEALPDGTLKIGGKFVRVEIASGTNYTSKTHYTPLYRIVDDSDA
jgi:hypothetical protein